MNFYISKFGNRHNEITSSRKDRQRVQSFSVYSMFVDSLGIIIIFGVYVTMIGWMENGTYVMGEAIHIATIPFENFARVSTWIFFSTIIGWYCI